MEAERFIKDKYIGNLLRFLQGEQASVTSPGVFQDVIVYIQEQCDLNDNSSKMHQLYKKLLAEYFEEVVHPKMQGQMGENFLLTLVEQWNKYTMFTMLLNRLFDYVDRNHLKGINLPRLGQES